MAALSTEPALSGTALQRHLRRSLLAEPPAPGDAAGGGDVPGVSSDSAGAGELRAAAVLIPILDRPGGAELLLTRRSDHLRQHAGQISFPGGGMEAGDADPAATALRESREEIGLDAGRIAIMGYLEPYVTVTGYSVVPVVGWLQADQSWRPDGLEVAEAFRVPLGHVLDPANRERHHRRYGGRDIDYYVIPWRERRIWGATAAMLIALSRRLGY